MATSKFVVTTKPGVNDKGDVVVQQKTLTFNNVAAAITEAAGIAFVSATKQLMGFVGYDVIENVYSAELDQEPSDIVVVGPGSALKH
jgi:hypothetical protein